MRPRSPHQMQITCLWLQSEAGWHAQGELLVAGVSNVVATAEDCCQACWMYGGSPGRNSTAGAQAPPFLFMRPGCSAMELWAVSECLKAEFAGGDGT